MRILIFSFLIINFNTPLYSVTTKMFKVLDTCARYRLKEIDAIEAVEKLKLKHNKSNSNDADKSVKSYCSVFTPNEKIEF